ncbi:MAG: tetratricopeptide repeat protein [Hyphomicrobiales bacterium]|nr:tetratricopeptide repeat protein [Hyphomicrobiales bacterium]
MQLKRLESALSQMVVAAIVLLGALAAAPAKAQMTAEDLAAVTTQHSLESLLGDLAVAPDAETAKPIEQAILREFLATESPTIELLMSRVAVTIQEKKYNTALALLDNIIELDPSYAEGWNKRATVNYLLDDYVAALRDVERALALQPNHFGAVYGLGLLMREFGARDLALDAFERALSINPFLENAQKAAENLEPEIKGVDI